MTSNLQKHRHQDRFRGIGLDAVRRTPNGQRSCHGTQGRHKRRHQPELISWLAPSAWCPKEAHNSKAARSFPRAAHGSVCRSNFAFVMDAIFPLAPFVGSDLERGLPPASERCDIRCHNAVRLLEPVPPRQRCVEFSSGLPIQLISGIAGTIQPRPATT